MIGVLGTTILCFLGIWQVQRLAWKEGLIAEIAAQMSTTPVPLPVRPDPATDALRRVVVTGQTGSDEVHVLHSIKRYGPGFRVIVPMTLDGPSGRRILVDLGYIPQRFKSPSARPSGAALVLKGDVTGFLLWPIEGDDFTPAPDLERNIWFERDVAALSDRLGTDPVMIVAETHPGGDLPLAQPPGANLPNRHLEYAVTWFSLAAVWSLMTILWVRLELRRHAAAARG